MRKVASLLCLIVSVAAASGQTLIQAPAPAAVQHSGFALAAHYSLLAGVAGARAVDWAATSQAMREGFQEGELPASIAKSKPGLAAFEFGSFALESFLSQRLYRHHPRLSILVDSVSFGVLIQTDVHSYREIQRDSLAAEKAADCPSTTNPICGR